MTNTEILGWAAAYDKNGDTYGMCHLVVTMVSQQIPGTVIAGAACDRKRRTSGQVHKGPPEYAPNKCRACEKIELRIKGDDRKD